MLRRNSKLARLLVAGAATATVALGGVAVTASPASAHTCRGEVYYNAGGGGCSSEGRETRLAVECKVIGSHFTYTRYSGWRPKKVSWWTTVFCTSGSRATKSYIQWK